MTFMTRDDGFDFQRRRMVDHQLAGQGIRDSRVLEAIRAVPRHLFVPAAGLPQAYENHPVAIGQGQTISQPYMVARMTELLQLSGGERVLEIGSGSGYQTAVLKALHANVFTVERLPDLSRQARENVERSGYSGVHYRVGDGFRGWPEE